MRLYVSPSQWVRGSYTSDAPLPTAFAGLCCLINPLPHSAQFPKRFCPKRFPGHVLHRDLKPDNIMVSQSRSSSPEASRGFDGYRRRQKRTGVSSIAWSRFLDRTDLYSGSLYCGFQFTPCAVTPVVFTLTYLDPPNLRR